jgi:hypothetical protein
MECGSTEVADPETCILSYGLLAIQRLTFARLTVSPYQ